jgi:hypothetical protein
LIAVSIYTKNVGIESPGFAHARAVTDASGETISRVLDQLRVDEGDKKVLIEKIRSDGWKSYGKVPKDNDIAHHRVVLANPNMAAHLLPCTHRSVSNVKAVLKGPHRGVSEKHFQRYLSEACYRLNRRYWDHELFNRLLFACTVGVPITRDQLRTLAMGAHLELRRQAFNHTHFSLSTGLSADVETSPADGTYGNCEPRVL